MYIGASWFVLYTALHFEKMQKFFLKMYIRVHNVIYKFFHPANISWLGVILEVFMMALSVMKLGPCVSTKAKQITSHFS